jgi:flagellar hook-associated protein 2
MGTITSSVGLISGINTGSIIDQLIAIEQQPVTQLQARIATNTAQQSAFTAFNTQLTTLQGVGQALERPLTWASATATSSNTSALTATASAGASTGSFQFNVAQLVTAQQSISNGYGSSSSLVGAGNITLTLGGGNLSSPTTLAQLNGGTGVPQGEFRITDRSGKSDVIDASSAITLDDVVQQINNAQDINVHATIENDHLVLTDNTGQTTGSLSVQDVGSSTTADALGIAGTATANALTGATANTIIGSNINTVGAGTALTALNNGLGVETANGAADFQVTTSDGSNIDVTLGGDATLGDVVNALNKAGGSKFSAAIDTANNSITLTDTSGGGGTLSVTALNNSNAAHDLGLDAAASGNIISGHSLIPSLDSVLLSGLHGGAGVPLGTISIADRTGASATVDLSGANSVQDVIDDINNTAGISVTASLNSAGNGIQLVDKSGGTGNLVVGDIDSTTAASLGIAGTFDDTQTADNGGDLHVQFVSQNTLLSQYNGGKGVNSGSFSITTASGATATVDTTQGVFNTIGDIVSAINAKQIGVTASINANGNGILLTDNTTGTGHLTVANVSGTTASDLQIAGTATENTIDGSLQKTIAVTSTDTLATLQQKIQQLGFGASAALVDDGSGQNSEHLSFTAFNSGTAGRVVIDGGTTSVNTQTLVQAQNAAVFYGGGNGSSSLLITSDTNQITNVIPGVTLQLTGVSNGPVTLNVAQDPSGIITQLQSFTTTFNAIVTQLDTDTAFDTSTNQGGLLLGDATAQEIQSELYVPLQTAVKGAGKYTLLSDIGITIGNNAQISFDQTKFQAAFAADPTDVENLFTQVSTGLGAIIDQSTTKLIDPVSGVITLENNTLTSQNTSFQTSITNLNATIADKKAQLEEQFANMEQVLATLQSQQSALSSLTGVSSSSSSSKSSSSSSSSS